MTCDCAYVGFDKSVFGKEETFNSKVFHGTAYSSEESVGFTGAVFSFYGEIFDYVIVAVKDTAVTSVFSLP